MLLTVCKLAVSVCGDHLINFQVKTWYDEERLELIVTVLSAADLPPRANGQYRTPYAKVYLLPDRR